jgi:thiamine transport system ATP-binding protein
MQGRDMLKIDAALWQLGSYALRADWQVAAGARVAVLGPSGAGKSTLLLGIAGHLAPNQGQILWQGADIYAQAGQVASMLFQDQNLFPHLTLAQNVVLALTAGKRAEAAQIKQAEAALARVGLAGLGARKPSAVSGGQMGRAALARVLLQDRPLLLLDEPFAALGPQMRAQMLDLVSDVAAQTKATVLIASHDPAEAARFADMIVFVENGVAQPPVAVADFLQNPPEGYLRYAT